MPLASWWTAIRQGTPLPSSYWRRTRWPGPFGATMPTSTPSGGSISPKWIAKPWAKSSRLPGAIPSLISAAQSSALLLVGQQDHHHVAAARRFGDVEDLEARLFGLGAAGGIGAQADDDVETPESFRLSAWAWPWEP